MKKQDKKDKKHESKAMKAHPDKAQDIALINKMVKKGCKKQGVALYNINNNSVQLQLPAPELKEAMTGSQVLLGALIANPCKIIFDNQSDAAVELTMSSLGLSEVWHTFPAGEAIILDNDIECFPQGTSFYATGAGTGDFSISYTYIKAG